MKINCLIIEDDLIDRETILGFAGKIPSLHVLAACSNAIEANVYLASGDVELLFSDIEMADLSGLDLVKALKNPPPTIFITSFPNYAVEGFQVDAVDYLVKPITFERFLKAVNKASARVTPRPALEKAVQMKDDHFFVRMEGHYVKLKYDDVIYIAAYGDFVKIYTPDATHIALVNLKSMEEQLPPSLFIRIHRSYLMNLSKIESIDSSEIKASQYTIPLGQIYKDKVYALVLDKRLVKRFSGGSPESS